MINWDRVRTLREEVGPEDFDEVLELFFSEVEEAVSRLPTARDPHSLSAEMHFLKGAALNLGFETLSRTCDEGETKAIQTGVESIEIDQVVTIYQQSKSQFISSLSSQL